MTGQLITTSLQPAIGVGTDAAHYLRATTETTLWGRLPCDLDSPVLTVAPGTTVVIDTVSHEGMLDDQGRDPAGYFAAYGVPAADVLTDAVDIAAHGNRNPTDGPHIITGPIHVTGARPGDLLAVSVESLLPRAAYGIISSRHGLGALPGEFPLDGAAVVSTFCSVDGFGGPLGDARATLPLTSAATARPVRFPLRPFLGVMGVATRGDRLHSVPPGLHGGNIDIALLQAGSTLYLPVQIDGAGFYCGDPHYAQGNGEVALTALEAPLRAQLTFDVVPAAEARARFGGVQGPFVRTPQFLVPTGLDEDLNEAMRKCVRNALELVTAGFGMEPALAFAYLSAATDFEISQVVDMVKGVHARIRIDDFAEVGLGPSR